MNKELYVVGIGPGAYDEMTLRACNALKNSELIVGYSAYVDLIRPYFPDKEFYATPMRGETARCRYALEMAASGKRTAVVCSGDELILEQITNQLAAGMRAYTEWPGSFTNCAANRRRRKSWWWAALLRPARARRFLARR